MKLIFELVAQDVNVGVELAKQRDALKALNKELKGLDEGTDEFERLKSEAIKTKIAISDLTVEQKKLNNEFKATKVPKDSLAGLRLEYSKLAVEVSKLSKTERESAFGQNLIKQAAKVKLSIDGVEQSMGRFTGNVGNYKSAFGGIASVLFKITGAFALLAGGPLLDATRETEKYFAVLKNAVGDEQSALRIFDQIKQFALDTPFQLNEIVDSFVKLEQRNFNPTIDQLRVLGDIAASQGKSIGQFTEAILDAQTGEFERLKEFGIVAKKSGDDVTLSFKGQSTTIKNTSENISNYLLELGKLPGISGAASAVAKTLDGSLSNLSDNFTQLLANIGGSGGILKSLVDGLSSIVGLANELISVPLSEEIQNQQIEFNALVGILQDVNVEESTRNAAINELQTKYGDYIGNIDLETASQAELSAVLEQGNKLFLQRIFLQQNEEKFAEFAKRRIVLEEKLFKQRKEAQKFEGGAQGSTSGIAGALVGTAPLFTKTEIEQLNKEQEDFRKVQDELSLSLFGTAAAAKKAKDEYEDLNDKVKDSTKDKEKDKKEREAAIGSLEFLQKKVSDLNQQLDQAPPNQIPRILGDLVKAEFQLQSLKDRVADLRNPETDAQVIKRSEKQAGVELGELDTFDPKELTDAQREAAVDLSQFKVETEEFTNEQILDLQKDLNRKLIGLTKDELAEQIRLEEEAENKKKDIKEAIQNALFDSAISFVNEIANREREQIQVEQDEKLSALDIEYQKKRDAAQGNAQALAKIDKDYQAEKAEIEKEAARERKRIAIIEAAIAGALGTIKALPNIPLSIATAIATAAQIAIIASQKFAVGGFTGSGTFKDDTGERVVGTAVLHEKEYVAPRAQVEQFPSLFRWLDSNRPKRGASRGYGMATGGFSQAPALSFATAESQRRQAIELTATAVIDERSARLIADLVGEQTYSAVANGLNDADRTNERKQRLEQQTNV